MKVSTYETGATRPVCCSCDPEWECGFWEVVGDRFKPCPGKVFGSDLAAWPREVRSPWLRAPTKPTLRPEERFTCPWAGAKLPKRRWRIGSSRLSKRIFRFTLFQLCRFLLKTLRNLL